MPKKKAKDVPTEGQQYALIPGVEAVKEDRPRTLERRAFVDGMFNELNEQLVRYLRVVEQLADLQARIMIMERNLRLTREHLKIVLGRTDEDVPQDWEKTLRKIRFIGARLGDSIIEILQEHGGLATQETLDELNRGQFRFRTGSPLREINAALLRQRRIKREGDRWIYKSPVSQKGEVQPQD